MNAGLQARAARDRASAIAGAQLLARRTGGGGSTACRAMTTTASAAMTAVSTAPYPASATRIGKSTAQRSDADRRELEHPGHEEPDHGEAEHDRRVEDDQHPAGRRHALAALEAAGHREHVADAPRRCRARRRRPGPRRRARPRWRSPPCRSRRRARSGPAFQPMRRATFEAPGFPEPSAEHVVTTRPGHEERAREGARGSRPGSSRIRARATSLTAPFKAMEPRPRGSGRSRRTGNDWAGTLFALVPARVPASDGEDVRSHEDEVEADAHLRVRVLQVRGAPRACTSRSATRRSSATTSCGGHAPARCSRPSGSCSRAPGFYKTDSRGGLQGRSPGRPSRSRSPSPTRRQIRSRTRSRTPSPSRPRRTARPAPRTGPRPTPRRPRRSRSSKPAKKSA